MNSQNMEIFDDLGPIQEIEIEKQQQIEEESNSIIDNIDKIDRSSFCDKIQSGENQTDFKFHKVWLSCTHLQGETKQLIKEVYHQYSNLIMLSQELTYLFGLQELFTLKTTQLVKLCLIGQLQLLQIVENLQNTYNEILDKFQLLSINQFMIQHILNYLNLQLLPQIKNVGQEFFIKKHHRSPRSILIDFKFQISKLFTVIEQLPHACSLNSNDILCLPKTDFRWQQINQHLIERRLGTPEQLKKSYQNVINAIESAQAMYNLQILFETNTKVVKGLLHTFGSLYYMINQSSRHKKAKILQAEARVELAFAMWNMGEKGLMKKLMPIMFKSIEYKQIIHISRYFKIINDDYLKKDQQDSFIVKTPSLIGFQQLKDKQGDKIRLRVLCKSNIQLPDKYYTDPTMQISKPSLIDKIMPSKKPEYYEKIIIHIHGGGFVAMSSRSHQNYTRIWANEIEAAIFSIDYRLSPQNGFPAALDDCWQAYLWILNFGIHYFNIIPKKVILVGDSAGGNLCAALCCLCIKENIRIPDGLLLCYPALDISENCFTLSQLIALEDSLLPHTFLKLCRSAYIQNQFGCHYLASPNYAPDEILSKFPSTHIMSGTRDPLHDDIWKLQDKLLRLNRDCSVHLYYDLPHGFLSFDPLMPESSICVQDAKEILKYLLGIQKMP